MSEREMAMAEHGDDGNAAILEALSVEDCLRLARSQPVGRVAIAQGDGPPHVVPVNFVIDDGVVAFRSDTGSKFRLLRGAQVTFEVDGLDPEGRTGWSVVFQGPAYEASHWETDHLQLSPWGPGPKAHWVRIVPTSISGRRIHRMPRQ